MLVRGLNSRAILARRNSSGQDGRAIYVKTMTGRLLDLSSPAPAPPAVVPDGRDEAASFLGVHFACCEAYSRVYVNRAGTAYVGHCPRCAKRVEFGIGPGGTSSRFFMAQ